MATNEWNQDKTNANHYPRPMKHYKNYTNLSRVLNETKTSKYIAIQTQSTWNERKEKAKKEEEKQIKRRRRLIFRENIKRFI